MVKMKALKICKFKQKKSPVTPGYSRFLFILPYNSIFIIFSIEFDKNKDKLVCLWIKTYKTKLLSKGLFQERTKNNKTEGSLFVLRIPSNTLVNNQCANRTQGDLILI